MLNTNEYKPILIEDLGMIYPTKTSKQKKRHGIYKCGFCGNNFKAQTANIENNHTQSCGCYAKQRASESNISHGLAKHRLYGTWRCMMQRCTKENHKHYVNYGGRGIKVCKEWYDVENFINDMDFTYNNKLTLDRINNDGNYERSNCRWVEKTIQQRNSRILRSTNTSGYRGVSFNKVGNIWISQITIDGSNKYLGRYKTPLEAAVAYDTYIVNNNLEHTKNNVLNL